MEKIDANYKRRTWRIKIKLFKTRKPWCSSFNDARKLFIVHFRSVEYLGDRTHRKHSSEEQTRSLQAEIHDQILLLEMIQWYTLVSKLAEIYKNRAGDGNESFSPLLTLTCCNSSPVRLYSEINVQILSVQFKWLRLERIRKECVGTKRYGVITACNKVIHHHSYFSTSARRLLSLPSSIQ